MRSTYNVNDCNRVINLKLVLNLTRRSLLIQRITVFIRKIMSVMSNHRWGTADDACRHLNVDVKTLQTWRRAGYLKQGTHWRSTQSNGSETVIYQLQWSKEEMEYWRSHDANIISEAA